MIYGSKTTIHMGHRLSPLQHRPCSPGSLDFHVWGRAGRTVRRLLELPNGLHFRRLALSWSRDAGVWWISELVVMCSHALESFAITNTTPVRSFVSVPYRWLNPVSSWVGARLTQPLESDEAP